MYNDKASLTFLVTVSGMKRNIVFSNLLYENESDIYFIILMVI